MKPLFISVKCIPLPKFLSGIILQTKHLHIGDLYASDSSIVASNDTIDRLNPGMID